MAGGHERCGTAASRVTAGLAVLALAGAGLVGTALTAQAAPEGTVCTSLSPDVTTGDAAPGATTLPDGWRSGGSLDYGFTSGGLRVSNATVGNVYLVTPRLASAADERTPGCDAFTTSFTIAAVGNAYQEGLNTSVALGDTARYGGVLGFRHHDGHLEVYTVWVPVGTASNPTEIPVSDWRSAVLATLDPAVPHTVDATAYLAPGDDDDVLQVSVDGTVVAQGVFTWEPYAAREGGQTHPHPIDTVLFRSWSSAPASDGVGYQTGVAAVEATRGSGFLFSNLTYSSFDGTAPTPVALTPCTAPTTTPVSQASGLLDTDLAASPTRSLGGHEFTDGGLHVWTTGTSSDPATATSDSKSAGYLDVDVPLAQAAPVTADVTVNSGSAPGLNLVLADGRILVHEANFGDDSWWSGTPTPGLPAGPHPTYQRAFGTLAEWASVLPAATVAKVGYSLGSAAIGDATFRSLTFGCTVYSFVPVAAPPTGTPPPPDAGHADTIGTSSDALLAALDQLGVGVQTPAQAGVTISDSAGPVTGAIDPSTPLDVVVPWTGADTWVDVYLYSNRVYVGTFPLVDGAVQLTGLDVSALAAGTHYLVLVGQQSGAITAVRLAVAAAPGGALADTGGELAATGADTAALGVVAGLLLVAGGALALVRRLASQPGTVRLGWGRPRSRRPRR